MRIVQNYKIPVSSNLRESKEDESFMMKNSKSKNGKQTKKSIYFFMSGTESQISSPDQIGIWVSFKSDNGSSIHPIRIKMYKTQKDKYFNP